jgi:hypothetical protein
MEGGLGLVSASAPILGYVSTEGGPLLIPDRDAATKWAGGEDEAEDYLRACAPLDADPNLPGHQVSIDDQSGVIWDMPTGTATVWSRADESLVVSRTWLPEEDPRSGFLASLHPDNAVLIGYLDVQRDWLVILWSAENGRPIAGHPPADGASLDLSVGQAGIVVAVSPGTYACYADEVADGTDVAHRCLILAAQ